MAKSTTLKEFESVFPRLVEDILDASKQYKLPADFVEWYKKVAIACQLCLAQADARSTVS